MAKKELSAMSYAELRALTAEQMGEFTPEQVKDARERMAFFRDQLELEKLSNDVERERNNREKIKRAHDAHQKALDDSNKQIKDSQAVCRHKKGGKNLEGILKGNDSNYSVIHHTHAWGEIEVLCTRCGKEWHDPDGVLSPIDRKANPAEYRTAKAAYEKAKAFETDNEPSGSQLFMITRIAPSAPARA